LGQLFNGGKTEMNIGVGNLVAIICIVISVIFAIVTACRYVKKFGRSSLAIKRESARMQRFDFAPQPSSIEASIWKVCIRTGHAFLPDL
jgi:hypothetical protein